MSESKKFIPLSVPHLDGNEWAYIQECLDTNWVSSVGSYVDRFEREMAAFTGASYAVATANGTAALHIALLVAGVERGDYVLLPNLTFIASANAVRYVGAEPILVDVVADTWQMDVALVAAFLEAETDRASDGTTRLKADGRRVKAIMPVHVFGNMCDMDALLACAEAHGIAVVEDATESLGSHYKGRAAGTLGLLGCLSFNGNKIMTTGGGGMVLTNDPALARRVKHLTTQAKSDNFEYVHDEVGYNYRLVNILAAMGVAQLEQMPHFLERKRAIAAYYCEALAGLPLVWMRVAPYVESNHWLFTILSEKQGELFAAFSAESIQVRPIWRPMHQLDMYAQNRYVSADDHTNHIYRQSVSLPCSVGIEEADLARVVGVIKRVLR